MIFVRKQHPNSPSDKYRADSHVCDVIAVLFGGQLGFLELQGAWWELKNSSGTRRCDWRQGLGSQQQIFRGPRPSMPTLLRNTHPNIRHSILPAIWRNNVKPEGFRAISFSSLSIDLFHPHMSLRTRSIFTKLPRANQLTQLTKPASRLSLLTNHLSLRTMASSQVPKTMKGILIEKTGGTEVLQYKTDLPVPTPKDGEVLVKNDYIGINYIDT